MAKRAAAHNDIKNMSFEQALKELEEIVRALESGEAALEASISQYERGSLLKDHCEKKLKDAKLKVDKIITRQDGSPASAPPDTEPFDIA